MSSPAKKKRNAKSVSRGEKPSEGDTDSRTALLTLEALHTFIEDAKALFDKNCIGDTVVLFDDVQQRLTRLERKSSGARKTVKPPIVYKPGIGIALRYIDPKTFGARLAALKKAIAELPPCKGEWRCARAPIFLPKEEIKGTAEEAEVKYSAEEIEGFWYKRQRHRAQHNPARRSERNVGQKFARLLELFEAAHHQVIDEMRGPQARGEAKAVARSKGKSSELAKNGLPIRFSRWAIGTEDGEKWHVFTKVKSRETRQEEWRHQGTLKGVSKGLQNMLLNAFAEGGGILARQDAVKMIQPTSSPSDRSKLVKRIGPEVSRLRAVILAAIGVPENLPRRGLDPLPWQKADKSWRSEIEIGYAGTEDGQFIGGEHRLRFKRCEKLSKDERLDQRPV